MQLSEHFTLEEFTRSQTATRLAIDNTPPAATLDALRYTAEMLEQVRAELGVPIHIDSGYRSRALNEAVGGTPTSQHCNGEAADILAPAFGSPRDICVKLIASKIPYDQLILEGDWVHISFSRTRTRHSTLTAHFSSGKVSYTQGIA